MAFEVADPKNTGSTRRLSWDTLVGDAAPGNVGRVMAALGGATECEAGAVQLGSGTEDPNWFPALGASAFDEKSPPRRPPAAGSSALARPSREASSRQQRPLWLASAVNTVVGGFAAGFAPASSSTSRAASAPPGSAAVVPDAPSAGGGCSPRPLLRPGSQRASFGDSSVQPKAVSRLVDEETGEVLPFSNSDEAFPPRLKPSFEELVSAGLSGGPLGWSTDQPVLAPAPRRSPQVCLMDARDALATLPSEGPSHPEHDNARIRGNSPPSTRRGDSPMAALTATTARPGSPRSRSLSPSRHFEGAPAPVATVLPLGLLGRRAGFVDEAHAAGFDGGAAADSSGGEDDEYEDEWWDGDTLPWNDILPQAPVVDPAERGLVWPPQVDLGWDCEAEIDRLVAERLEGNVTERMTAKSMQKRAEYVENSAMGRLEELVRGGGWAMLESLRQSADVLLGRVSCIQSGGSCNRCVAKAIPVVVYCDGDGGEEEDPWAGHDSSKTENDPYAPLDSNELWSPRAGMSPDGSGDEETPRGKGKGKGKKGKGKSKGKNGDDMASTWSDADSSKGKAKGKGKSPEEISALVAKAKGKGKSEAEVAAIVATAKGKGGKGKGSAEDKGKGKGKGKDKGSPPATPRSDTESSKGKGKDKGKGKGKKGKGGPESPRAEASPRSSAGPGSPRSDAVSGTPRSEAGSAKGKGKGKGKSKEDMAKGKGKGKDGAAKGKGKEDGQSVLGSAGGLNSEAASALSSMKGGGKGPKGKGKDGKGKGDAGGKGGKGDKGKGKSKGKPG